MALRKFVTRPNSSVNRPSSSNPSKASNTSGFAFSISSRSRTQKGCRRTRSIHTAGPPCGFRNKRREASPPLYSLMSRRTKRSFWPLAPKQNSDNALARAVFPTPVGPQNSNTPKGRAGSIRPVLIVVTNRAAALVASGWPMTCAANCARTLSTESGRSSRRNTSGRPVRLMNCVTTFAGVTVRSPGCSWIPFARSSTNFSPPTGEGESRGMLPRRSHRLRTNAAAGPGNAA